MAAMPLRSFLPVLRLPHVPTLLLATASGRLGRAAASLALVLLVVEESQSYGLAGAAAAVLTVADAATAPIKARLVDRFGPAAVLLPLALGHAAALLAVAATTNHGVLMGMAAVAGMCVPPLSGASKAMWPALVRSPEQLAVAYVLESALQQVLFFLGPLYVTVVGTVSSPGTALVGVAACAITGTAAFVGVARSVQAATRAGIRRPAVGGGALAVPTVAAVTATTLLQSVVFGAYSVALPAAAPDLAGILVACGPCGGLVGTVLLGARPTGHYARLFALTALLLAPLVIGLVPLIALCTFTAGLFVTPLAAIAYQLVQRATPETVRTEAFTWLSTANAAGAAVGAGAAGVAIDALGLASGLAIPASAVLCAAFVAWMCRAHLQDRRAERTP
jgi:hypothetical protein